MVKKIIPTVQAIIRTKNYRLSFNFLPILLVLEI